MNRVCWTPIAIVTSALILASDLAIAEAVPDEDLLCLAHKKFAEFTSDAEKKAFETFFEKTQNGETADLNPGQATVPDPRYADCWGKERVIQAEWLKWLCTDPKASGKVTSKGVDIAGARIHGQLDLRWVKIQFPLRTSRCAFTGDILLDRASLRGLELLETHINGLHADGLTVERDVFLSGDFRADGKVWLQGATIDGRLSCRGGQFIQPNGIALNLRYAKISTSLLLGEGFRAEGAVLLLGTRVGGSLLCGGGQFINPRGQEQDLEGAVTSPGQTALNASGANIQGDVSLEKDFRVEGAVKGFRAEGAVLLLDATVGGSLLCGGGQFINPRGQARDLEDTESSPGETALNASRAYIQGNVRLDKGFEADGEVSFQGARIEHDLVLEDVWPVNGELNLTSAKAKALLNGRKSAPGGPKQSWPKQQKLHLHGFTFDELHKDAAPIADIQIKWIKRQPSNSFRSQPYEQMAKVFRDMGLQDEGIIVMIAKNSDAGRHVIAEDRKAGNEKKELWHRFWYKIFGKLIGYGYRSWNAFFASLVVIAIGAVLFKIGYLTKYIKPTADDAYLDEAGHLKDTYPKFNTLIYSLETFIPLVKLKMEEYWIPNANRGPVLVWFDTFPLLAVGGLFRFYLWFHIIAGWILTTLWVGGLTGLIKS